MHITEKDFGQDYHLITLRNEDGFQMAVTDLGARIVSLGKDKELILGFDSAQEYLEKDPFIGATIGRTAGRIEKGQFSLDGKDYQVSTDPATGHSLHGGKPGFEEKNGPIRSRRTKVKPRLFLPCSVLMVNMVFQET